ncbi:MAG: hypothetical protein HY904_00105 [Deltaproteobacteria bacterium]|nr:hypothetical protein [Deltaproteobacteria bacterium]
MSDKPPPRDPASPPDPEAAPAPEDTEVSTAPEIPLPPPGPPADLPVAPSATWDLSHDALRATLPPPLAPDPPPAAELASPPPPDTAAPEPAPADPPAAPPPAPVAVAPASWSMPPVNPERSVRRVRPGTFAGGVGLILALACLAPSVVGVGWVAGWWGASQEPAPDVELGPMARDVEVVRRAVSRARDEMQQLYEPAMAVSRVEARRSAYRGAALVDGEVKRLQQEQAHAVELEAALTRQPALASKQKQPPIPPAALEPFLRRVGLTTPADSAEGEVVVDESGSGVGGAVPAGFEALVAASAGTGTAESEGRVAQRAPVAGQGLYVVAVRRLPVAVAPGSFNDVGHSLDRLMETARTVPDALERSQERAEADRRALTWGPFLALAAGLLLAVLAWRQVRLRVVEPLRYFREQLERVRSGLLPDVVDPRTPLADLHGALASLAEHLQAARAEEDERRARSSVLDSIIDACRRAQQGDYTARPASGAGSEGLAALAVCHMLDAVEQRALRLRTQAQALNEALGKAEETAAPTLQSPHLAAALETLRKRLDSLAPLSGLLRNLAARLQSLSAQGNPTLVQEDLARLSAAVAPRASAVAALLNDMQDNARRLSEALSDARGASMTEALTRARAAAIELARDARTPRMDESFPGFLSALRGVAPPELERAWRVGLEEQSRGKPS